jgi:hypothetical protein
MMSNETILPDSVAIFPHIQAFDLAAKAWVDESEVGSLAGVHNRSGR